jgi:hypothetical protein
MPPPRGCASYSRSRPALVLGRASRVVSRTVRRDRHAVRQQLAGVLEDDHAITEKAPALLWVTDYRVSRLAVRCRSIGAWRRVRAHSSASWLSLMRLRSRPLRLPCRWPRPLTLNFAPSSCNTQATWDWFIQVSPRCYPLAMITESSIPVTHSDHASWIPLVKSGYVPARYYALA